MKHNWIILILVGLMLVACGGAEKPAASNDRADSSETGTSSEGPEVDAFTLENLRYYGSREYYLRQGENILAIAEWITEETSFPFPYDVVVARIVELNQGNIAYNSNNLPGFADTSELSLVNIPALPDLPSNMELGIAGPSEEIMMHTVGADETLYSIAPQYGFGTYQEFATAARVNPDAYLQIGQVLTWTVKIPAHYIEDKGN